MNKDTIQILTVNIPVKFSLTLVHLNEIMLELQHLPHEINPNVAAIDIQTIFLFQKSLDVYQKEIALRINEIRTEYEKFAIDEKKFI